MQNILFFFLEYLSFGQQPYCAENGEYGGAILAMIACGEYASAQEACEKLVEISSSVYPDEELTAKYEEKYRKFSMIYPAMKEVFKEMAQ